MSPRPEAPAASIADVLEAFAADREQTLSMGDARLYRYVLLLLELCINNYGHRNLDCEERRFFETEYHRRKRHFFELFGVDKLLPELEFFCTRYLDGDVHTSERVVRRAPGVVSELREWPVGKGLVTPDLEARERARAARRTRLRHRVGRLLRALREAMVSLDPDGLDDESYIPCDHHPVARLAARRVWLSVFRGAEPELVGPLVVPECVSSGLRVGWSLFVALGRVRGRWRIVEVVGIYPRV